MSSGEDEQHEQRLTRLSEILADIAGHAQVKSLERCPYKSKPGLCTAKFSCRNQQPAETDGGAFRCGHRDGTFDYRLAWEARPESYDKVRSKLQRIRAEAEQARQGKASPPPAAVPEPDGDK